MENELNELKKADRSLFPISLTMRAIRDSRYHNTAYAITELIDNSIEANASLIELLCMEEVQQVKSQSRRQVSKIAILDNGSGMSARTLIDALKFGGGTRHNSKRGIGKYGMGLPTSSMSQCQRVDVWTWQKGINSAWHSSIDAKIVVEEDKHSVPIPDQDTAIPETWRKAGNAKIFENDSGTLVVWSELDKIQWKTAKTIIEYTHHDVGRIHRMHIDEEICSIRAASFLKTHPSERKQERQFVANDPLYLMSPSSTPKPWNDEPMFKEWGAKEYTVPVNGQEIKIDVKYSIVKPEALKTDSPTQNPGDADYGKHARRNIGVSVVRENREIVLESAFLREGGSADNPQNRWWGCEVRFPRACDEMFGVDHNKQMVVKFTQAAKTLAQDDRSNQLILDEMGLDEDEIHVIVGDIRDQTRAMMREIKQMFEQRRPRRERDKARTPEDRAVKAATDADKDAINTKEESPTQTDIDRERIPPEKRKQGLLDRFMKLGHPKQDAEQLADNLVREELSYHFNPMQLDGHQIFNVRSNQGVLHVNLNTEHRIYDWLKSIEGRLDDTADESNPAFQAIFALRLLLLSWARMEDHTENRDERARIQDIAMDWGRQVDKFVKRIRDRDG